MGIADIVLMVLVALLLINNMLMFAYCRFAEKMDARYFRKRAESNDAVNSNQESNDHKDSKAGLKSKIGNIYRLINAYVYGLMRYNLICVGKIPSHSIRKFMYKHIYRMKISKKTVIYGGCEIRSPWNITIGNAVIAVGCLLDGRERITIGNNVVFGSGVHLWTEEHDLNDPYFRVTPNHSQPIIVEDYAWVCSDSTVLPGTHIGRGAVVASRACVVKDCEPYGVYGGIPAKKISERNVDLKYELNGQPTWHFY